MSGSDGTCSLCKSTTGFDFVTGLGVPRADGLIKTLLGYSLIEQKESSDSYSMHVVVHDWIREFVNKEEGAGGFVSAALSLMVAIRTILKREVSNRST